MTTLVMAGILLFGMVSYRYLPVSDLPNVDYPTIQVQATLPGASPETMASAIATPLERQFTTIAGIDSMSSVSALGLTQITIQFSLERSIDAAAQDVQAMIAKAAPLLPPGMPTPPFYQKVNPADQPVIYLSLSSPTLPLYTVDEYAQTNLAQRISTINGVAQVQVFGSQKYAVRVQLDPRALTTRGIGIDEVEQALARSNVNLPTGTLYGAHQMFNVQATGQLTNAAAFRPLIVAYRNGSPVRLQELGRVIDSVQTDKVASWYNDERAVILAVQRQPGTNTVEVVDAIRALLPRFRAELPASVNLNVLYDRSVAIRESVHDVEFTLLSMTLSLVAVFIPVLFMGGVVGRLLHEFAVVITVAVLVSGFVSLTLTPMACSRFLRPPGESHGRLYAASERFFDGMLRAYDHSLQWVLRHRRVTIAVMLLTFVVTAWLFVIIPKGFIPTEDTGQIFAFTEAAQDISFDAMKEKQRAAAAIVLQQPYIDQIMSSIGASTINVVPNTGRIFMRLKPRDQRPPADKIIEDLRPKLAAVPGLKVYPQNLPIIRIGGSLTKALYQYTLQATDLRELYRWAPILYDKMRTLPGFTDVNTDLQVASPQITVDIDRDRASALGVTAEQIENALYDAYGSPQVSTSSPPTTHYRASMSLDPKNH